MTEYRVERPAPDVMACASCSGTARRRYGFRVGPADAAAPSTPGHEHHDGLGTCGLAPTAARALTARLRGDERSLEREFRSQERAISEGTLTPSAGVHEVAHAVAQTSVPAA